MFMLCMNVFYEYMKVMLGDRFRYQNKSNRILFSDSKANINKIEVMVIIITAIN